MHKRLLSTALKQQDMDRTQTRMVRSPPREIQTFNSITSLLSIVRTDCSTADRKSNCCNICTIATILAEKLARVSMEASKALEYAQESIKRVMPAKAQEALRWGAAVVGRAARGSSEWWRRQMQRAEL